MTGKNDDLLIAGAKANLDRMLADCREFVRRQSIDTLMMLTIEWGDTTNNETEDPKERVKSKMASCTLYQMILRDDWLFSENQK